MKLRKSKSDRYYRIEFRMWASQVVKNKCNVRGHEVRDQALGPLQLTFVLAHTRGSALRGFLWGRDRHNVRAQELTGFSRQLYSKR